MPHPDPAPTSRLTIALGPIAAPQLPGGIGRELPLQGLTILAVEDSRYASEALRLIAARAGARLRRAETIATARAHLRTYRPNVVIVDLGLPDGRGDGLIRELVMARNRPQVVLGSSGLADGRALALAAGADGYLEKPLDSLAGFCRALLRHLPDLGPVMFGGPADHITPDPLALEEDLAMAAGLLAADPGPQRQRFVAGFLTSLGQQSGDDALVAAASVAADAPDLRPLQAIVQDRLAQSQGAFAPGLPIALS